MAHKMIPLMDLKRQYEAHKSEYLRVIEAVCENTAFSGGPYMESFERAFAVYCDVPFASGVSNGTTALQLAMLALGIQPGDEVILPANTFIATAWAPTYVGATPVFADCTADTWSIDPDSARSLVTPKTRAIMGVHLYGQPFDIDPLREIAREYGLFLVEDCAQAQGALYKGQRVGGLSDIGCFSFYPSKNLGCFGEGGAVISHNESYIRHINRLKNHGCDVQYHHDEIGYNMRMEGIQAAVLEAKLKYLDAWNARRNEIAAQYRLRIQNPAVTMQRVPDWAGTVSHLFVVLVEQRGRFVDYLKENNVMTGQHYPIPCHLQKAYAYLGYKPGSRPNAEHLAKRCVSLPVFPELADEEVSYVIDAVNAYQEG